MKRPASFESAASSSTQAPLCPDCQDAGAQRDARRETWCQGFCWIHARARGFLPPNASPSMLAKPLRASPVKGGRAQVLCPLCDLEGAAMPARSEAWCQNHCKRHANELGFLPPGRTQLRRSPARVHFLTKAHEGKQRRLRCQESSCPLRARGEHGELRLCKGHCLWRQRLHRYASTLSSTPGGRPPPSTSSLARWLRKQLLLAFLGRLLPSQTALLRSIPRWQQSLRAYLRQHHRDRQAANRELADMDREDLEADAAARRGLILRRDQSLLAQASVGDGGHSSIGFNYHSEPALGRFCTVSQKWKPLLFKVPGMLGTEMMHGIATW